MPSDTAGSNARFTKREETWKQGVALVTGANSGIGYAITRRLLDEGLTVVAVDKDATRLQDMGRQCRSSNNGKLISFAGDLRDKKHIQHILTETERQTGRLDICVNCAGLSFYSGVLDGEFDDWEEMLQVNVLAVAQCSKEAVKVMQKNGRDTGHIINISSNLAHNGPPQDHAYLRFYAATKHALRSLTDSLRSEMREARSGIRVSAVTPALVKTDFMDQVLKDHPEQLAGYYEEHAALQPEDVADAVVYALSAPAHVEISEIQISPVDSGRQAVKFGKS